jgi:hypothetical protein
VSAGKMAGLRLTDIRRPMVLDGLKTRSALVAGEQPVIHELRAVGHVVGATLSDVCTRARAQYAHYAAKESTSHIPHRFSRVPPREGSKILRPCLRSGSSEVLNPNQSLTPTAAAPSAALPRSDGRFGLPHSLNRMQPTRPSAPFSVHLRDGECRASL